MAAGISASTNVTELIPEITLEAATIYQDKMLAQNLVTVVDRNGLPGLTVEFPRWTEVAGSTAAAETAAPASHQMDLAMPTITMAKRNVYVIAGDVAKKAAQGNIVAGIGETMGMAKVKQDDTAIFNVVTGSTNWTTGTGATNGAITVAFIQDGLLLLELNEVDDDLYAVLHPKGYDEVRDEILPTATTTMPAMAAGNEILATAHVGSLLGASLFKSNRISSGTVTATTEVWNSLLFAKRGIGYAWSWLEVPGIEVERTASSAFSGLVYNYLDGAGVIYDSAVCKLYHT